MICDSPYLVLVPVFLSVFLCCLLRLILDDGMDETAVLIHLSLTKWCINPEYQENTDKTQIKHFLWTCMHHHNHNIYSYAG